MKVDCGNPVVPGRLEITFELAYLTPAFKIVVGISAFFERDNFSEIAKKQGKSPPDSYYTDSHIVPVQNKNITIQPGFDLGGKHNFSS